MPAEWKYEVNPATKKQLDILQHLMHRPDVDNMRVIRFHDLRHSCASMLLANGVPMKQIQEWLGHSDFSTTANIYAHLDFQSKVSSAEAMLAGLGLKAAGIERMEE